MGNVKKKVSIVFYLSIAFFILVVLLAIIGELIVPYDPFALEFMPLQSPSLQNILGTDDIGRDIFSRIIIGTRISVLVGIGSVAMASFIGTFFGLIASHFRKLEALIMRVIDALWSIPTILLALSIAITLKSGLGSVIVVIGIVYCPIFTRLVFAQAVVLRENDFILASRAIGCKTMRLLFRHMLPNLISPLIVQGTLAAGTAIVLESTMSFLGVGIQPPTPSWGVIIRTGYNWIEKAPWMAIFPGLTIYFTVISLNIIGDRLRIKLDPKQKLRE